MPLKTSFSPRYLYNISSTMTFGARYRIISIFHGCMVWIEKSVTRVTDRHHEACIPFDLPRLILKVDLAMK